MGLKDWIEKVMGDEELEGDEENLNEDIELMPRSEAHKETAEPAPTRRGNKVLNINATTQLKVVLAKPTRLMMLVKWPMN